MSLAEPAPGGVARGGRGGRRYEARKEGRTVAVLTLADDATVFADVYPRAGAASVKAGPYRFAATTEADAFLEETVEALLYLGCDVT